MEKAKQELYEWMKALGIALIAAFVIRTFLFSPAIVKGESMMPTLINQDRMVVTKIGEPERFDVIVFHATESEDYVKRVIGLPGDRIEYKDDVLYINGKAYDEPYLDDYKEQLTGGPLTESFTLEETPIGSETVPEGHLFVMGDNRRYSKDSRHIGAISMDQVVGTTKTVFWPVKDIKIIK